MAKLPDSLYDAGHFPDGAAIATNPNATQKDAARFAVQAKTAYDTCVLKVEALKKVNATK